MFHKMLERGEAGDQMGVLLKGAKKEDLRRGMCLAQPGTMKLGNTFKAQVCCVTSLFIHFFAATYNPAKIYERFMILSGY